MVLIQLLVATPQYQRGKAKQVHYAWRERQQDVCLGEQPMKKHEGEEPSSSSEPQQHCCEHCPQPAALGSCNVG